jgi:hypothetical protein
VLCKVVLRLTQQSFIQMHFVLVDVFIIVDHLLHLAFEHVFNVEFDWYHELSVDLLHT